MLRSIVRVTRKRSAEEVLPDEAESDDELQTVGEENENDTDEEDEELEPYIDWILRATEVAVRRANEAKVSNWLEAQRKRKWEFAGHIARRNDGRWSKQSILWEPSGGKRKVGHPTRRWSDCLEAFAKLKSEEYEKSMPCVEMARDRALWFSLKADFVKTGWH
jgi:hypothetical protein